PQQAVERVAERGWAIFLEEKMPGPGKAVAQHRQRPQQQPLLRGEHVARRADHAQGAEEMQSPAGAVRVLAEVIRVELGKTGKALLAGHDQRPLSWKPASRLPSTRASRPKACTGPSAPLP